MNTVMVVNEICLNVDNENDKNEILRKGGRELTPQEVIAAGMAGYENIVSPANTTIDLDGTIVFTPPAPLGMDELKAAKLNEINTAYQQAIADFMPIYPDGERLTFDKQEQEARAWLADNSTPTPFVDALAAGRQMDKAELVSRIISKANAFAVASGLLTGQRQRYEDMLDVASTVEDVAAVVPEYSLPGMETQA